MERPSHALTYVLTYAALIALSAVTLTLAFLPLGLLGTVLAIGIASIKGVLIAIFFMHLREQRSVNSIFLLVSLILVAFFVALSALDLATRAATEAPKARMDGSAPQSFLQSRMASLREHERSGESLERSVPRT